MNSSAERSHPKQKQSHARTHKRRAHHALSSQNVVTCSKCREKTLPHRVCESCGTYKDRDVLGLSEQRSRKEERALRRRAKEHERAHQHDEHESSEESSK